jgi:hypothetical protein
MKIQLETPDGPGDPPWAYVAEFWNSQAGRSVLATKNLMFADSDDLVSVEVLLLTVGCGEDGTISVIFPVAQLASLIADLSHFVPTEPPACTCFMISAADPWQPAEYEHNPFCPQHPDERQQRWLTYGSPKVADQLRRGVWPHA